MSYGWPLWRPPTEKLWRKFESVVCLPLRCCLGLPVSTHKLSLFVEFALVRPQLWHDICAIVFAHRVDVEYDTESPQHPAHIVYREQSRTRLPPKCPKHRIPLAKAVKTVKWQFRVDHGILNSSRPANLRKLALTRQIRQITSPKGQKERSSYAKMFRLRPAPASYIMCEQRPMAVLRGRIRLNRHHLRDRQHKLGLNESPHCPACMHAFSEQNPETSAHVLLHCPRFEPDRMQLLHELQHHGVPLSLDAITGDLPGVSPDGAADIRSATATFLRRIDRCLHI